MKQILCWIQSFAALILYGIMAAVNAVIAGIGALIAIAVSALPGMPDDVEWTGVVSDVFGYANWAFAVGYIVTILGVMAVLWAAWAIAAVFLRWGKAT